MAKDARKKGVDQRLLEERRDGLLYVKLLKCHGGCTFGEARAALRPICESVRRSPELPEKIPWNIRLGRDGQYNIEVLIPDFPKRIAKLKVELLPLGADRVPIGIISFSGECTTLDILTKHAPRLRIPVGVKELRGEVSI